MTPTENFISKAKLVHGDTYNYSETKYLKSKTKVLITCKIHGSFYQMPNAHLSGQGCPKCGVLKRDANKYLSREQVLSKCIETHGDKYDYSKIEFTKVTDKVTIGCKVHGWFNQILINHYRGQGCPKCGKQQMGNIQKMSLEQFIAKSKLIHGNKYDYNKVVLDNYRSKVVIICKKHGEFTQSAENHYCSGAGCPKCANVQSKAESEIVTLIRDLDICCYTRNRTLIKPLELDIVIPSLKIAIEYNGLIWHSEKHGKDKWYHYNKSKMCANKGYRLIHIWEDDWNRNKQLQIEFLKYQLGVSRYTPIYARECTLATISKKQASEFLDLHHIQGSTVFSEAVCLAYKGEIVTVSCFTKRSDKYELVRHCSSKPVIGSLGKCVKHFHKIHNTEIYTFLDKSRYTGESYEKAGFIKACEIPPDYMYVKGSVRYHKFNFRRAQIKRKLPDIYSDDLSESQMMEKAGYTRIWDCGKIKYVFSR